jgi:hypothetical protein
MTKNENPKKKRNPKDQKTKKKKKKTPNIIAPIPQTNFEISHQQI